MEPEYDTLVMEGLEDGDVVFTSEEFGTWNINRLKVLALQVKMQMGVFDRANVQQLVSANDVDEKRVEQIIKEGRRGAILLVAFPEDSGEAPLIVDGHHRLAASLRIEDPNQKTFRAPMKIIPPELADLAKVSFKEVCSKTGQFKEIPHKELLRMTWGLYTSTDGTMRREKKMFKPLKGD